MGTEIATRDYKALALQEAASEPIVTSNNLRVRGGTMFINDVQVPGNRAVCVVIDTIRENTYFVGDYDADTPQSPVCYALARDDALMGPHVSMQQHLDYFRPQNATCKGCPMNEYGTAAKGKGKACQNRRRLYLIPAGVVRADLQIEWITDPNHYRLADPALMRLPVTSVKNWANYVNQLASTIQRPSFSVATGIGVIPDPKSQWKITFECLATLPDNVMDVIEQRRAMLLNQEPQGYQPPNSEQA